MCMCVKNFRGRIHFSLSIFSFFFLQIKRLKIRINYMIRKCIKPSCNKFALKSTSPPDSQRNNSNSIISYILNYRARNRD